MKKVFRERRARKVYQAIVRGVIPWDIQDVDAPIGLATDSAINLRRGINTVEGVPSRTTVKVLRRLENHTLVSCRIHTGRTHQIRVHMEHLGFPLLGDKLYGHPDEVFIHHLDIGDDEWVRQRVDYPRHTLHAWKLSVPHPSGRLLSVEAPLPADMATLLEGAPTGWPEDREE